MSFPATATAKSREATAKQRGVPIADRSAQAAWRAFAARVAHDFGRSYRDIGRDFGISRERARQLCFKAERLKAKHPELWWLARACAALR